jgi:hypothetical protein
MSYKIGNQVYRHNFIQVYLYICMYLNFIGGCYVNFMSNWVSFTVYYDQIYLVLTSSSLLFGSAPFSINKYQLHPVVIYSETDIIRHNIPITTTCRLYPFNSSIYVHLLRQLYECILTGQQTSKYCVAAG